MISFKVPVSKTIRTLIRKVKTAQRKALRRCIQCNAKLFPEDGCHCPSCAEKRTVSVNKYRRKNPDRAVAWLKADQKKNPEKYAKKAAEYYHLKKLDGTCVVCSEPAEDDSNYCATHLAMSRKRSREYIWRKNGYSSRKSWIFSDQKGDATIGVDKVLSSFKIGLSNPSDVTDIEIFNIVVTFWNDEQWRAKKRIALKGKVISKTIKLPKVRSVKSIEFSYDSSTVGPVGVELFVKIETERLRLAA